MAEGAQGDGGSAQRLAAKDIVLNQSSDIGYKAGAATRFEANLAAIRTLKDIESEKRQATPEEQVKLAKYSGFGDSAFGEAFPRNEWGNFKNTPWGRRREELKALTTEDEFKAIEKSRLNAFYTTPEVINAMWKGLERLGIHNLKQPHVLEPSAGSGRFLGFQPPELAAKSQRTAVELDSLTGRMVKQLYPNADTYVMGFQEAPIPKESIDVAISNVPFGNYPIFDPTFKKDRKKLTQSIHNYFFAKTLEELRPGGVLAFITSHQTLDAPTSKPIRQALAKEAEFIGAIRLPNNAFPDTKVVTDIIYMKKRMPNDAPGDQSWIDTEKVPFHVTTHGGDEFDATLEVNKYFVKYPEMVMGIPSGNGSMNPHNYNEGEYTVEPKPGLQLAEELNKTIGKLPSNIMVDAPHRERPKYYSQSVKAYEGAHIIGEDGNVYVKKSGGFVAANLSATEEAKVKALMGIRDAAKAVIDIQVRDGDDSELATLRGNLNTQYKGYVTVHGPLAAPGNVELLENDPDAPFLKALERNDLFRKDKKDLTEEDNRLIKVLRGKAPIQESDIPKLQTDIFNGRVIHGLGIKPVTDYADAESIVKNQTGRLDFNLMADKLGKTEKEVIDALAARRLIFENPVGDWEPADQYLTGDVREKLRVAERAASVRPKDFKVNVEALKEVQPKDIPAGQIGVRMGAPWIPASDINDFTKGLLNASTNWRNRGKEEYFKYNEITGEWQMLNKPGVSIWDAEARGYGTERISATNIIHRILNGKPIEINDQIEDEEGNKKSVRNVPDTIAAQEKARIIQQKFQEWIWEDTERAERLAKEYNNRFNNYRARTFNGAYQELPGISQKWNKWMHSHQKDAIARVVNDRTALLAHEVGFGKTAVMVASGMELRRLGLSQKNLYVVPKATHAQFKEQFLDIYPYAKVLFPGEDDFTPAKRAEFISRAVTGDWDAVIVSDSQYRQIPVRPETEEKFLNEEIDTIREALQQEIQEKGNDKKNKTQKELQKTLERALVRMQNIQDRLKNKDDKTIYFEDIGVDQMYVDEADMFKNLHFTTRMGRIKGLPNSESDRAWDMYQKVRYLQENKNNGVVFATGTPIANTIAEMYTMMRYLQEPMLEEKGIKHFDAWAKTFGETTESLEQTPTGQYRMTQRFAKFANAPELSGMWQQIADIRVADEVPEMVKQRPRIVDEHGKAKRTVIATPPDQALTDYMAKLAKRADELGDKDPREDNMLKISSDARKASLDMRLVEAGAPVNPNGKVTIACKKISDIYTETAKDKGTQLVFLDMGTPKAKDKEEVDNTATEDDDTGEEQRLLKDVYSNIKSQLIANGVPEKEIAFIHDAKNDKQKEALFKKVNAGEIRVLIGSTGKMGAGVNVQERAAALHHLDAPWRPRDIEQREGRIIRQGNKVYGPQRDANGKITDPGPGVRVYTYVTEKSFDAYMWQAIEAKSKAIKAIMRRSAPPRAIEDIDSFTMSASEAKAVASGDPDVMKQVTLKNSVSKYQMLRSSYLDSKIRANSQLQAIPLLTKQLSSDIEKMEKDAKLIKDDVKFHIKIKGMPYAERSDAGEALAKNMKSAKNGEEIAEYRGFKVQVLDQGPQTGYKLVITSPETGYEYATTNILYPDLTGTGAISRLDNRIKAVVSDLDKSRAQLQEAQRNLVTYKAQADKPFEYQEQLDKMEKELDRVSRKLQGEKVEDSPSDNYTEPEVDDGEVYHYGQQNEEQAVIAPKAEIDAVKQAIEPVENKLEVKEPTVKQAEKEIKVAEAITETAKTKPVPEKPVTPKIETPAPKFHTKADIEREARETVRIAAPVIKQGTPYKPAADKIPQLQAAPKEEAKKQRKPRTKIISLPAVSMTKLEEVQLGRSDRAKIIDNSRANKVTIEPNNPRTPRWIRDQGSMDIQGIDTPKIKTPKRRDYGKKKSTTKKKGKNLGAGIVLDRRGRHLRL